MFKSLFFHNGPPIMDSFQKSTLITNFLLFVAVNLSGLFRPVSDDSSSCTWSHRSQQKAQCVYPCPLAKLSTVQNWCASSTLVATTSPHSVPLLQPVSQPGSQQPAGLEMYWKSSCFLVRKDF